MITFTRDWRGYAKGSSVGTLAATIEALAVSEGAAVYGGVAYPLNSYLDRNNNPASLVDTAGNLFSTPIEVMGSGLPFIMPSSGTVASTGGSINGFTGFNAVNGPSYSYFPANALYSGSPAGWWYTVWSGATYGTVYAERYTSGQPAIPASPTPLITVAGSFTQSTGVDVMGPTFVLPANSLGPNGEIQIKRLTHNNNSAGNKITNIYMGGTLFQGVTQTTTSRHAAQISIQNRGNAGRQVAANAAPGDSGSVGAFNVGTVDTTVAQVCAISLRLDTATDWTMLESYAVTRRFMA